MSSGGIPDTGGGEPGLRREVPAMFFASRTIHLVVLLFPARRSDEKVSRKARTGTFRSRLEGVSGAACEVEVIFSGVPDVYAVKSEDERRKT